MSLRYNLSPIRYKDLPTISLTLPGEFRLWSYGVLQEYFPHQISFRTQYYTITVTGEDLLLRAMTRNEVLITGKVTSVTTREEEA